MNESSVQLREVKGIPKILNFHFEVRVEPMWLGVQLLKVERS